MPTINIPSSQLAAALRGEAERVRVAMPLASYAAANRLAAYLAEEIDRRGITDRGHLKNSIRAERTPGGASVEIDAPHAGVVELGARPHGVSPEGREAIVAWAVRKLGVDDEAAKGIAWAICERLRTEGQEPTYVVRDSMPKATKFYAAELARILRARK